VTQLKEVLEPYREGKCAVLVRYSNSSGSANLKLDESWNVSLHSDLVDGLRNLLGEQNVRIAYS
jgi:DNA polymerase-3 subunit alpha